MVASNRNLFFSWGPPIFRGVAFAVSFRDEGNWWIRFGDIQGFVIWSSIRVIFWEPDGGPDVLFKPSPMVPPPESTNGWKGNLKTTTPPIWEEVRNIRQQKRINFLGVNKPLVFLEDVKDSEFTTNIDGWICVAGFSDHSLWRGHGWNVTL